MAFNEKTFEAEKLNTPFKFDKEIFLDKFMNERSDDNV